MADSLSPALARACQLLTQARRVLLVSDGAPDGDSIGSTLALYHWLTDQKKDVTLFCREPVPEGLKFLDGVHRFEHKHELFNQPQDVIVTLDAGDLKHCGIDDLLPRTPTGYTLIAVDHHSTNKNFGHLNAVDHQACSTCEVVYRFFQNNGLPIDHRVATCLLAGTMSDTSHFINSATSAITLEMSGRLLAAGARMPDISRYLIKSKNIPALKLWGLALSRLQYSQSLDMVVTYFLRDDLTGIPGAEEAVDGMSNYLSGICNYADAVMVLRETRDNQVRGSLRSLNRDISQLAKQLGGGGHQKAAGFTMPGLLTIENGLPTLVSTLSI